MKKILIIIVCLLMLVTGCMFNEDNSLVKKELSEGMILRYWENENGLDSEPDYQICVYSDKYITYGDGNLKNILRVELTNDEYQEIVNYIENDSFLNLNNDLSVLDEEDNRYSQIIVYYNNYTDFAVGGTNIKNETYLKLVELLEKYKK